MPTVSALAVSSNTANAATYSTGAFTPASGLLLVGLVAASGTATSYARMFCTSEAWCTFTFVTSAGWNADANRLYAFVANGFATGIQVRPRFDCTGDNATGSVIQIYGVSSMSRTGSSAAVRQYAFELNQAVSTRPNPSFSSATFDTNAIIGGVAATSSPPGMTPTTGWTEGFDTGFATPSTGLETMYTVSNVASTVINWGSSSNAVNCSLVIEFDASEASVVGQTFIKFPIRMDGIGFGGIFPGNRVQ